MKERNRFGSLLKQKLDDFRCGFITMDGIIKFLNTYYKKKPTFAKSCKEFTEAYDRFIKTTDKKLYKPKCKKQN
tara:strand:+ start:39 stop:260 length:222 start_codon:yes stop_codon:yes gene_type:complete